MATLYVTEFVDVMHAPGEVQIGMEPEIATQTVAIGGTSTATTNAFKTQSRMVRLHTDAICSVVFAASPTATTSNRRMSANQTEYFAIPPGQSYKVAAISNT